MPTETLPVVVTVISNYIAEHSDEQEPRYVFTYQVTINNNSDKQLQLLSRYWQITDADNQVSTVTGDGVVGKQPVINPNSSYQYTSGCILKTPVGAMQGHYIMQYNQQMSVKVDIPAFGLAVPNKLN